MTDPSHGIEPTRPDAYLKERVDDQLAYYGEAASRYKKRYMRMQTVIIVLGVLVPVVINLPDTIGGTDLELTFRLTATLMSLTLAIVSGVLNLHKFGDLWLEYRLTEESLKKEKFLYLTGSGKYADPGSAFPRFVENVEGILSAEHTKFRSIVEDASRDSASE
jgi:hypothetical protein